jgi:rfaE bifunctional protein kinase chain/domain
MAMLLEEAFTSRLRAVEGRLYEILKRFDQGRVMVVGDLGLDEFLTGEVERVSREAPVLILRHEHTRQTPGGGANAAFNLAKLGGMVKVVGLVGDDEQGRVLRQMFEAEGIDTRGMLVDGDRPTVTKTRISGHARQSVTQQIVRVDRKSDAFPHPALQHQLRDYIQHHCQNVDAIVCSDYGDGVLSTEVIGAILQHPCVIVDAQADLARYQGATLFTPNVPEAEKAVGYDIVDPETLQRAGQDLLQLTQSNYILMTRGDAGMTLFEQNGTPTTVPAFNRTDVFDVTGAGDTVVAALTLSLGAGATAWEAAVLGNLAASIVVRKFGTETTSTAEMMAALNVLLHDTQS